LTKTQSNHVISATQAAKISLDNGLKMIENCFQKVDVICDVEAGGSDGVARSKKFVF
jgi:hypothetical protein